jgi:hypothetical protein
MALVLKDRVQQTGTANTTVSFTLSGSVTGFQSFSAIGDTNTTYYAATDTSGNWEAGLGTYSTTGPTLTRTTILSSSNSGSAVTFSGTVTVFCTYPSSRALYLDGTSANINVSQAAFTANGIPYASSTTALATGSTLTYTATGLGINSSSAAARLQIGTTALSSAAWTTSGVGLRIDSAIYTSSAGLTGTVTAHSIARPTFAATTAAQTVTAGATLYIAGGPVKGTNVSTLTEGYALYIAVDTNADSNAIKQTNNVYIGGKTVMKANNAYDTAWSNLLIDGTVTNTAFTGTSANLGAGITHSGGVYTLNTGTYTYFNSVVLDQYQLVDINNLGDPVNVTDAATLKIVGAPYPQNNFGTFTNSYALYVSGDQSYFGGRTIINPNGTAGFTASQNQPSTAGYSLNVAASKHFFSTAPSGLAAANSFGQPTYQSSIVGTTTITDAATLYVANAPTVSANGGALVAITNPWALHVAAGASYFGGGAVLGAGTASVAPLDFTAGTLLTTPVEGAMEFDGTAFYTTDDVTDGRGYLASIHYFRLAADVTAFGPAIGNFFGATSGMALDAGVYYEVEAYLYFTKTTAGTVTFTMTFTQGPANNDAHYVGTPVGGIGTVGSAVTAAIAKSTATAGALPVTGTLTTAVNHQYTLRSMFRANATTGGTFNIQITSSAGTVTPLTGSYYKLTRLPAANTGAFA